MSWQCFIPKGADIPKESMKRAWVKNPDSGGYAYAENGEITIQNGFGHFEDFYESYSSIGTEEARIVFFLNTYTYKNLINSQPLRISDSLVFTLPGYITGFTTVSGKSDAVQLNELVLAEFFQKDYTKIESWEIQWMLRESIGDYNPMVFLTKDGHGVIINAQKGEWDKKTENLWYNNKDHEPVAVYIPPPVTQSTNHTPVKTNNPTTQPYLIWLRDCYLDAKKQVENEEAFIE